MNYTLIFDCPECGDEVVVDGSQRGYEISHHCGATIEISVMVEVVEEDEK